MASIRWVRPLLTTVSNSDALADSLSSRWRRLGTRAFTKLSVTAMWMALGKTSLLDCEALTWSFGCTGEPNASEASEASTSLAFMLLEVPEPVWKTSSGKW